MTAGVACLRVRPQRIALEYDAQYTEALTPLLCAPRRSRHAAAATAHHLWPLRSSPSRANAFALPPPRPLAAKRAAHLEHAPAKRQRGVELFSSDFMEAE